MAAQRDAYNQPIPPAPVPERVLERRRRDKERAQATARREAEKQERKREAAQRRTSQHRGRGKQASMGDELLQFALVGCLCIIAVLVTLPALLVAGAVYGVLMLRRPNRWLVLVLTFATVSPYVAYLLQRNPDVLVGSLVAYVDATRLAVDVWSADQAQGVVLSWLQTVWRTCALVGAVVGCAAYVLTANKWKRARATDLTLPDEATEESYAPPERKPLAPVGATELRAQDHSEASRVMVRQFLGSRRLTCIASWPKMGKSYAVLGLVRAARSGGYWFGKQVHAFRILWLSEESPGGFADGAETFDLDSDVCRVEFAQRFLSVGWLGQENFKDLCEYIYRSAKADGRDCVCWDSLTTFAPWALSSVTTAQFAFLILMEMSEKYDVATLIIAHNSKGGKGDDPVLDMLGSIGFGAMMSQVASFKRDRATGICTLNVQGRRLAGEDGEWKQDARLDGQEYVPVTKAARGDDPSKTTIEGTIREVTPGHHPQLPPPQGYNQSIQGATTAPKRASAPPAPTPKTDTLPRSLVGAVMALKAVPYGTAAYVTHCTKKSKAQSYRDLGKLVETGYATRANGPDGVEIFSLTGKGRAVQ